MHQEPWSNYHVSKLIQYIDLGYSPVQISAHIPFTPTEILQKADYLGYSYISNTWLFKD